MIIFKIPYFYITSKIASEKESKAKEGMKMMGLRDSTYYLSWFILYMSISIFTSFVVTAISMRGIFV
jgi:ABC-2 family transporter protein